MVSIPFEELIHHVRFSADKLVRQCYDEHITNISLALGRPLRIWDSLKQTKKMYIKINFRPGKHAYTK